MACRRTWKSNDSVDLRSTATAKVYIARVRGNETARTQEFVLGWSPDGGDSVREIVRQQWNFSPPESMREVEKYRVELSGVTVLELVIVPDIADGPGRASLESFRVS